MGRKYKLNRMKMSHDIPNANNRTQDEENTLVGWKRMTKLQSQPLLW